MEVVLLDTDVFSYLWQQRPEAEKFAPLVEGRVVALSFTAVGEAYYGAYKRKWGERKLADLDAALRPFLILPYNRDLAMTWARVRAECEAAGTSIPANDCWIAATAIHYGVPLLTNNARHFPQIADLQLLVP